MGETLPPGLGYFLEIIGPDEEAALLERLNECPVAYYPQDPDNPRASLSYGWKYDFRTDSFFPCAPLPDWLAPLRARVAELSGLEPEDFVECLINRYEPGAHIQWHFDKPVWEEIAGVSLASGVTMDFRKEIDDGFIHAKADLPPRSLYVMTGEARHAYQHHLSPMIEDRWSLTFRVPSAAGHAMLRESVAALS